MGKTCLSFVLGRDDGRGKINREIRCILLSKFLQQQYNLFIFCFFLCFLVYFIIPHLKLELGRGICFILLSEQCIVTNLVQVL